MVQKRHYVLHYTKINTIWFVKNKKKFLLQQKNKNKKKEQND